MSLRMLTWTKLLTLEKHTTEAYFLYGTLGHFIRLLTY